MGNQVSINQQINTISIPRSDFMDKIVLNTDLSYTDLRVVMLLLTKLDGFNRNRVKTKTIMQDKLNFTPLDNKEIAKTLYMSKKDVKQSLRNLVEYEILEVGNSETSGKGYRFNM